MFRRFLLIVFAFLQLVAPFAHAHPGEQSEHHFHDDIPIQSAFVDHHAPSVGVDHHATTAIGIPEALEKRVDFLALVALAVCLFAASWPNQRSWPKTGVARLKALPSTLLPPTRAPPQV